MNFQQFLDDYAKNRELSGTILVSRDDSLIANKSFGFADCSTNIRCCSNTQYLIGSVTKQFTAAALLRALYDDAIANNISSDDIDALEKKIDDNLNIPISYYLPANHKIWAGEMPTWANIISSHQLLIHSSGLINYTSLPEFKNVLLNPPEIPNLVSSFKNMNLDFPVGTQHSYSNSGYLLLGEIIEQLTGQPLDAYLEKKFFNPLNMFATSLVRKGTVHDMKKIDRFKNLARGYEIDISSQNPEINEVKNYCPMEIPGAAGSMISSAPDLLLWNSALYSGKVLPDFLLRIMIKPHIKMNESEGESYGYGIEVINNPALGTIYCHGGSIDGFIARLVYIPSLSLSIVCLSNIAKKLEKLDQEVRIIRMRLPTDINPSDAFKILEAELNKKFPVIITNKDRYFTTEFSTHLIQILSEMSGYIKAK